MSDYKNHEYNYRVLVVLIETGFIQDHIWIANESSKYPEFLKLILENTTRNLVREACFRQIIKFFGQN